MEDHASLLIQFIAAIRAQLSRNNIPPIICYGKHSTTDADFKIKWKNNPDELIKDTILEIAKFNLLSGLIHVEKLGYFGIGKSYEEAFAQLKGAEEETISLNTAGRLNNKIVIVTGGAQGFGKGIIHEIVKEGAYVLIADLNKDLAEATANQINKKLGSNQVMTYETDVTNPESVKSMVDYCLTSLGGIDILISNAGVLKAGSLEDLDESDFDFVTNVNYKGYFLCTKYCSKVMKVQHHYSPESYYDIIQINSKSGLEGSNKNFAYSGSKFGAIGLTQSFALELVPYNIKVNAICPGNYFDGPLWSDPYGGLFAQYLKAGKVQGAKSIEDVQRYYESKVPMKRGCTPMDVVKAIYYLIHQQYETGQALPVTGGQIMLH